MLELAGPLFLLANAFIIYFMICLAIVVPYFEVSILIRSGRIWKPTKEGAVIGLTLGAINFLLFNVMMDGGGEAGILAPLIGIAGAIFAILICSMLGQFYGTLGRGFFSKPRSTANSTEETT